MTSPLSTLHMATDSPTTGGENDGTDSVRGSTDTNCQQIWIPWKEPVPPRGGRKTHLTSGRRKGQGQPDWWNVGGEIRKKIIAWDVAPKQEYFEELFRVSRNQIIWGGNYFDLPPTRCFLVWRKSNVPLEGFSMASAEYAWTSFYQNAMVFEFSAVGQVGRFHPTQKPPELYRWIYKHFAHEGDKILDTHLGSGSSRIAAYDAGLDFVGYEIDETYFRLQEERFARHTAQMNLFID